MEEDTVEHSQLPLPACLVGCLQPESTPQAGFQQILLRGIDWLYRRRLLMAAAHHLITLHGTWCSVDAKPHLDCASQHSENLKIFTE